MKSQGYSESGAGKLFLHQIDNTIPITLDAGTGYVWKSQRDAPTGANITTLYKLTLDGDFYYTPNWSKAAQAYTQGWKKEAVGYVYA